MKGKKGASELTINKIVLIIILLLVLVLVLIAITKPGILSWIKNLPGYEQSKDSEQVLTTEQLKVLNYERVGKIVQPEKRKYCTAYDQYYIDLIIDDKTQIATCFYAIGDMNKAKTGDINIGTVWRWNDWTDDRVGRMENGRIILSITEESYNQYISAKFSGIPLYNLFFKLNESKYLDGDLLKIKEGQK